MVVIACIDIVVECGLANLLVNVVVIGLSWHRVVVIVGDILNRLQGGSHRLSRPQIEVGLVELGWGIVGGGCVYIGEGGGVVTVDILAGVRQAIVLDGSPGKLLSKLTLFARLCDALEFLKILIICITYFFNTFFISLFSGSQKTVSG